MSDVIKEIDGGMLQDLLSKHDRGQYFGPPAAPDEENDLSKEILSNLKIGQFPHVSVLGIDICKYSSYKTEKRSLIPFLFEIIYGQAINDVRQYLTYIFQFASKEKLESQFIPTGDGGFQLFATPIHAILFAIFFEFDLRSYNCYHCYPKLRAYIGELRVRYCITHDVVYKYRSDFYGEAIISNARLLACDKLNRCLIDRKCYDWFMLQMNGLENLSALSLEHLKGLADFKDYDIGPIKNGTNLIIPERPPIPCEWIKAVDVQSIGTLGSKESLIDAYNVHMQVGVSIANPAIAGGNTRFTFTIGNLNTKGLSPEADK